MINLKREKHLARWLGVPRDQLHEVADSTEEYCQKLFLLDPAKPEKPREVLDVHGILRTIQSRLYKRVLLPRLSVSDHSFGGVRGRHIKSNISRHLGATFVYTTDISSFYPSVKHQRVYRLFAEALGCAPDVARLCTKLCTYEYHLALGLVTSPVLADQILRVVDTRIAGACRRAGLTYTRFIDDIAISGPYNLNPTTSGIADLVQRILDEHGFNISQSKSKSGRLSDGHLITNIRVNRGHPDVRRAYLEELERQIADARELAAGREFAGPYYIEAQIRGRVQFVCWINPGRRRCLMRRFNAVPWKQAAREARKRGLVAARKTLRKERPVVFAEGCPVTPR